MSGISKLTGIALATAAAGLFSLNVAAAGHTPAAPAEGKIQCDGVNACKGKSECKTAKNACKGTNACKGVGFKSMTQAECDKAKAEMKKG